MKKAINILLIIFFPLGIIYCVGKALFGGNVASFLGGIFLCAIGAGLAIYFFRYDLIAPIVLFVSKVFA